MLKVSIITICYNNGHEIRATIESVINQTYNQIEYIIIDGASKDNSLSIINEYKDKITKIVSEPDQGIYDAINKGLKIATGDIVGLIHAGDKLYNNQVIEKIVSFFKINCDLDISYGNSVMINQKGKLCRINESPEFSRPLIRRGWMPSHQSIYCKREIFAKYGYYDTEIGWAADYEWFIRIFHKEELKIKRLKQYILKFTIGGTSTKSYKSRFTEKHHRMIKKCWEVNGLKAPVGIVYWQMFRKIKQILLPLIRTVQ